MDTFMYYKYFTVFYILCNVIYILFTINITKVGGNPYNSYIKIQCQASLSKVVWIG